MSKKTTILITALAFISIILLGLFFLPSLLFGKNTIINEFDNGTKLSSDGINKIGGGWDGFTSRKDEYRVILTEYHISRPIYSLVSKFSDNTTYIQIVQLNRTGLFDFKVESYVFVAVYDTPFNEAVNMASRNNLSLDNPNPEKIKVEDKEDQNRRNNPPTQEEQDIEKAQIKAERYKDMLYIKENWNKNENMLNNLRKLFGDFKTFEEFRNLESVQQTYGTVEWLGI